MATRYWGPVEAKSNIKDVVSVVVTVVIVYTVKPLPLSVICTLKCRMAIAH